MNDFYIGVIAGIVATIVIQLLIKSIKWTINAVSREANIKGSWNWFDSTNVDSIGTMKLSQIGSNIFGVFTRSTSITGESTNRKFKFKGTFYGDTLLITFYDPKNPKIVRGAIILKLVLNTSLLYGKTMYMDSHKNDILTYNFIMTKDKSLHEKAKEYLGLDANIT